jgi:hypothetical protein
MKKLVAIVLAAGLLSACGGGGSVPNAPAPAAPAARKAAVTFTIELPARQAPSSDKRSPRFVSPATLSAVVTLTEHNGAPVSSPQPYAVNVSPLNGCTGLAAPGAFSRQAAGASRMPSAKAAKCTFSIPALVGTDTFAVALYDAAQTSATPATLAGNVLSLGISAPAAVVENAANVVAITLSGVVASLHLTVSPALVEPGTDTPVTLAVLAYDADNYVITGPGTFATPVVLTSDQPLYYTIVPASLTLPFSDATTTYPGTNFLAECNPTSFTATSGSVTVTAPLVIDLNQC